MPVCQPASSCLCVCQLMQQVLGKCKQAGRDNDTQPDISARSVAQSFSLLHSRQDVRHNDRHLVHTCHCNWYCSLPKNEARAFAGARQATQAGPDDDAGDPEGSCCSSCLGWYAAHASLHVHIRNNDKHACCDASSLECKYSSLLCTSS